jgi:hypothetical protein
MHHEGIKTLLHRARERFPRLRHLWVDAGYRGEDKGADWVQKTLGWSALRSWSVPGSLPRRGSKVVGEGVGQRRRGRRLAEPYAP